MIVARLVVPAGMDWAESEWSRDHLTAMNVIFENASMGRLSFLLTVGLNVINKTRLVRIL